MLELLAKLNNKQLNDISPIMECKKSNSRATEFYFKEIEKNYNASSLVINMVDSLSLLNDFYTQANLQSRGNIVFIIDYGPKSKLCQNMLIEQFKCQTIVIK